MCPRSQTMQRSRHAVAHNERPRRQQGRSMSRSRHRGKGGELTTSTISNDLVLFNPDQAKQAKPKHRQSRAIVVRDDTPKPASIRKGDVREAYKVLPIVIGTGSFGTVRSCICRKSRKKLAIKSIAIKSHAGNSNLLKSEIALLQRINHKNVIGIVDVIQDREYIHIIMEQCKGGDLFDMTVDDKTKLSEGRVRKIITSLLDAIAYMHERNIVHRDLKAEHLMFASTDPNSTIKIIDFGVATTHKPGDEPMTAFAGSARSVAPEVVKRSYGKECDLWSVGVIVYFLLTQQMPFNGNDVNAIFQKIVNGTFYYPQWAATGLSEEVKDFMDRLIVVDPKKRMTAKQALTHSWIRGKVARKQAQPEVSRPRSGRSLRRGISSSAQSKMSRRRSKSRGDKSRSAHSTMTGRRSKSRGDKSHSARSTMSRMMGRSRG